MADEDPIIAESGPLKTDFRPEELNHREKEVETLSKVIDDTAEGDSRNLVIQGPRGTGKTSLILGAMDNSPERLNTCYVPGQRCLTQYKALQQIYEAVARDPINSGYHTADLQREIEKRVTHVNLVIVLDEIDFLLMNDGDDLLYYLSRLETEAGLSIIAVTANQQDVSSQIEERSYSSYHPEQLVLEPYTAEQLYDILAHRARQSLKPRSLHRQALTYIASTTQNASYALQWLQTAAERATETITEITAKKTESRAYNRYVDRLLHDFTTHHRLTYQAITELHAEQEEGGTIQAGEVYEQYRRIAKSSEEDPLSNRRISDYLKHLELLNLIQAEYHYGGSKGKTREIKLRDY
jgi:cell division control protein 6